MHKRIQSDIRYRYSIRRQLQVFPVMCILLQSCYNLHRCEIALQFVLAQFRALQAISPFKKRFNEINQERPNVRCSPVIPSLSHRVAALSSCADYVHIFGKFSSVIIMKKLDLSSQFCKQCSICLYKGIQKDNALIMSGPLSELRLTLLDQANASLL